MNPLTIGHQLLVNEMLLKSHDVNCPAMVFLSCKQDSERNPLDKCAKSSYFMKAFPDCGMTLCEKINDPWKATEYLVEQGFNELIFFCGSDRLADYKRLKKYFQDRVKSFKLISVAERDDKNKISGTVMREFVKKNDFESFSKYVPTCFTKKESRQMYNETRKGLK